MNYQTRKFCIRGQVQEALLLALIPNLPKDGTIEVVVREYKKNSTDEQRSLMWVRLNEIAEQAFVQGKQFGADVWHEQAKETFLPEEFTDGITRDGYIKWVITPKGRRALVGSTEMLTAKGKAEYNQQLEAFGATTLGVHFSANPKGPRHG